MNNGNLLERLGDFARPWSVENPFTNVYGLARSILAISTALTLAFNPARLLFTPVAGIYDVPKCSMTISRISVFCLVPAGRLDIVRWLSVMILVLVASGWRPRFTAVPHAWLSYSLFSSSTIFDGGDQITLVLTVLLIPVALLDARKWHWNTIQANEPARPLASLIAWSAILMIRLQVAAVYFVSGIAKLGVEQWANGTAMYYWLLTFGGAPNWVVQFFSQPFILIAMTWGTIALEVLLAAGLILAKEWRSRLLVIAILFHILIGLFFDLTSFALAMIAALILFLRPANQPFRLDPTPTAD